MVPSFINGTPTHVLIVHVVAVLLPVAIAAAILLVLVRRTRRPFALLSVAVAAVACVAVPLAFASGGDLRGRVAPSALVSHHVDMAHLLLPIAAVFGVVLAAFVAVDLVRRDAQGELNTFEASLVERLPSSVRTGRDLRLPLRVLSTLVIVLSLLTAVQVVRTGDSGAKASWDGRVSAVSRGEG